MAGRPRIHLPGGLYHVMLRGNDGPDIFRSDADRCRLHLLLPEGTCRFGYRVNSFCLMSNHLIIRKLCSSGRIWQNRFFSCVVGNE
jgi:REP-associated tyrosine transposase